MHASTRFALVIVALLFAQAAYAASDPPAVPLGCKQVGDPGTEDVWHFCPSGEKRCYRWSGYSVFPGGWPSCYSFGEPPVPPYTWDAKVRAWSDGGKAAITCTDIMCK